VRVEDRKGGEWEGVSFQFKKSEVLDKNGYTIYRRMAMNLGGRLKNYGQG
jgi:hypothetical protein